MISARSLVGQAVKLVAVAGDRVAPPPSGVVVLAYHQVGAPALGAVNVSLASFDEQIALLAAHRDDSGRGGVLDLDAALDVLASPVGVAAPGSSDHPGSSDRPESLDRPDSLDGPEPADPVVVTFDDGTADFVDNAVPILVRYGVPVTLYLATDFVERGRSFWDDGTVLSWAALREATSTGLVTIGSHTHTHMLLDRVDRPTAEQELDRSVDLIGERLAIEARHFAYPKALAPSPAADLAVRARFRSAALAGGRPNRYGDTDPWALARTPVQASDSIDWFARKARGGLRLEGALRERIDKRRHAGAAR